MKKLTFDYSKASSFLTSNELEGMKSCVSTIHNMIHNKTGLGNDFLGWVDLPKNYDKDEFERIKKAAKKIQSDSDVLLVIGIGGSYLGARACIETIGHSYKNDLT